MVFAFLRARCVQRAIWLLPDFRIDVLPIDAKAVEIRTPSYHLKGELLLLKSNLNVEWSQRIRILGKAAWQFGGIVNYTWLHSFSEPILWAQLAPSRSGNIL